MTNEGSNKIANFMTPGIGVPVLGHGHIGCIVKMHHSLKILFSTPGHHVEVLLPKLKFHNFWGRVSLLGYCHFGNTVKMHCFFNELVGQLSLGSSPPILLYIMQIILKRIKISTNIF